VEPVSDALMDELDALSVSVEDADADTDDEQALFGEPGMPAPAAAGSARPEGLFDDEAAGRLERRHAAAGAGLGRRPACAGHAAAVAEQDWVRLTQSQFAPVEITPSFWIVPSWHDPRAAAQVIRLDPGLAFGTGTHPTTRMCLRWIAQRGAPGQGQRVLDYGCGSGILAIGAALHRARADRRGRHRPGRRGGHRRPTRRPMAWRCAPACPTGAGRLRRWCWPTSWPRR
jgi:ribosomal protein L11 methyltransferase